MSTNVSLDNESVSMNVHGVTEVTLEPIGQELPGCYRLIIHQSRKIKTSISLFCDYERSLEVSVVTGRTFNKSTSLPIKFTLPDDIIKSNLL